MVLKKIEKKKRWAWGEKEALIYLSTMRGPKEGAIGMIILCC